MAKTATSLSSIQLEILRLLKENPDGLDINQIRESASFPGIQQHLDRRLRGLDPFYRIARVRTGKRTVYVLEGERPAGEWDYGVISKTLRAKILTRDGRRCQMCGKTVSHDSVRLHLDHKIPQEWGGPTGEENLWALCSACNEGKKNYFSSFDPELMSTVLRHDSVHKRIAELLHLRNGQWVDSDLIEFVANFEDYQADWQKRLRELRYLDLVITVKRKKEMRRTKSYYKLENWVDLPNDPSRAARKFEQARNKAKKNVS
jgi:hypothetical protein